MTNAKDMGWQVGMEVFVVRHGYTKNPQGRMETVTKVGRQWIYLARDRFDCDSLELDGAGYSSPGKVFLSEAEYIETTEISKAWTALVRSISYTPPKGITLDEISSVGKLLRLEE
jgi:hypothetical protein